MVVGGGCAGIACAVALAESPVEHLSKKHLSVTLLESDVRLGGRARSWPDTETGYPLHIGPHIVASDYPNYFRLLKRLGTFDQVVWQKDKNVVVTINGTVENKQKKAGGEQAEQTFRSWPVVLWNKLPAPLNWMYAVFSDPWVTYKDILTLIPFGSFALQVRENGDLIQKMRRENGDFGDLDLATWQALDKVSGQELLDKFGVSKTYQNHVMAFCANSILNVPLREVSGASLVSFFRRLIGQPGVTFGFIDGGLGSVLEPAEGFLREKNCEVLLETKLVSLKIGGEDGRVELLVEQGDKRKRIRPKHGVVLTLPALETLDFVPTNMRDLPARVLAAAGPGGVGQRGANKEHWDGDRTMRTVFPQKFLRLVIT